MTGALCVDVWNDTDGRASRGVRMVAAERARQLAMVAQIDVHQTHISAIVRGAQRRGR